MASKSLGTLTLDLIAKIGGYTAPLEKADRKTKQFAESTGKAGKAIGTAIGAGAVAAAAGIGLVVTKQTELIDSQAKMAQQLRTSYESIAVLGRAGDLAGVGIDKVQVASKALEQRLGLAIQGSKEQAAAFERLGLSAQEIADLPLDQRISEINKALVENVQASERAAVAGKLFGEEGAIAMQAIDPATIAEAARQVEIFGLNLSDVDAAKVEMAGDAMSTFGLLADGVGKQLTVELAPILQAIGDEFLDAAEEAGGLGTVVKDTTRSVVQALAFIVDAGDGVGRVFTAVANTLVGVYSRAVGRVNQLSAAVAEGLSNLPDVAGGAEFERQAKQYAEAAQVNFGIADQAAQALIDTIETPLAGQKLLEAYEAVQANAQKAAEATVAAREETQKTGQAFVQVEQTKTKAVKSTTDAITSQLQSLEVQVAVLGKTADEATLYKLALEGATEAQLAQAQTALETLAAFERQQEALEERQRLMEEVAQIEESTWSDSSRALGEYQEKIEALRAQLNSGDISQERYDRIQEGLEANLEKSKETNDEMSEYAKSAAQNMQSAFADFLFDPFEGGLDGMLKSFGTILQRMAAEAAAAQIFEAVGSYGKANSGAGGYVGMLAGLASMFGGGRAIGGPVSAGGIYEVGEYNRPELADIGGKQYLIPGNDGRVMPIGNRGSSGSTVVNNVSLPGITSAKEARQASGSIQRAIAAGVAGSARYA